MPGYVKLTRAKTEEPFWQPIDLIGEFRTARNVSPMEGAGLPKEVEERQKPNDGAKTEFGDRQLPTRVLEDPETVQNLIRQELRLIYGS